MDDDIGELKREFDELKDVGEKLELRVRYHETRAYHIALAYIIWERFLIAFGTSNSNSNPNSLNYYCSHWWMLLGFNLSCSILYILFFLEAVIMMSKAHNHLHIIFLSLDQISQQLIVLNNVLSNRPDPDQQHLESGGSVSSVGRFGFSFRLQALEEGRPYTILHRKLYFASILCALLALTAFQLSITFNYSMCVQFNGTPPPPPYT